MASDDVTSQDSTVLGDDLVEALGFEPIVREADEGAEGVGADHDVQSPPPGIVPGSNGRVHGVASDGLQSDGLQSDGLQSDGLQSDGPDIDGDDELRTDIGPLNPEIATHPDGSAADGEEVSPEMVDEMTETRPIERESISLDTEDRQDGFGPDGVIDLSGGSQPDLDIQEVVDDETSELMEHPPPGPPVMSDLMALDPAVATAPGIGLPPVSEQAAPKTVAPAGSHVRRRLRARKSRRVLRHIDPWSVLTFSVIFHLCFFASLLLASVLVWNAAVAAGTIENIESFVRELGDYDRFEIDSGKVFTAAMLIAGMLTLASSILVVLLTVVFNLISDLVGGIRVTVIEEETVRLPDSVPSDDGDQQVAAGVRSR